MLGRSEMPSFFRLKVAREVPVEPTVGLTLSLSG